MLTVFWPDIWVVHPWRSEETDCVDQGSLEVGHHLILSRCVLVRRIVDMLPYLRAISETCVAAVLPES